MLQSSGLILLISDGVVPETQCVQMQEGNWREGEEGSKEGTKEGGKQV